MAGSCPQTIDLATSGLQYREWQFFMLQKLGKRNRGSAVCLSVCLSFCLSEFFHFVKCLSLPCKNSIALLSSKIYTDISLYFQLTYFATSSMEPLRSFLMLEMDIKDKMARKVLLRGIAVIL